MADTPTPSARLLALVDAFRNETQARSTDFAMHGVVASNQPARAALLAYGAALEADAYQAYGAGLVTMACVLENGAIIDTLNQSVHPDDMIRVVDMTRVLVATLKNYADHVKAQAPQLAQTYIKERQNGR